MLVLGLSRSIRIRFRFKKVQEKLKLKKEVLKSNYNFYIFNNKKVIHLLKFFYKNKKQTI